MHNNTRLAGLFPAVLTCLGLALSCGARGSFAEEGAATAVPPAPPVAATTATTAIVPTAAVTGGVTPAATPAEPSATVPAKADAASISNNCGKGAASLRSGSSFQSLTKEQQDILGASPAGGEALACLAVAENKADICDSLSAASKGYCTLTFNLAQHLKGVAKKDLRAYVLNFYCLRDGTNKSDCEKGLAIMISGDSTRCKELSTDLQRQMCTGIVKGDVKICDRLEKPDDRLGCSMLVAPDASRCPKDSKPCQTMARMMKSIDAGGLEGLQEVEPALAAAQKGRSACASVLANLDRACKGSSSSNPAKAPKAATPKS